MTFRGNRFLVLVGLIGALGGGCKQSNSAAPARPTANQVYLDQAQPKLPTVKLWLGSQEMITEVARTQTQVATGMMHRKEMAENEGMLFVFAQPYRAAFYMRNTLLPLSAAYIDSEGVILEIHDLNPLVETPVEAASANVRYVLETKQSWFERNQVGVGAVIRTDKGTLGEMFFGRR